MNHNHKQPHPRNRSSKIPIPKGFAPDRETSGRICYRCLHVCVFGDGPRRCTFKCRRNQFKLKSYRAHQHRYELSRDKDPGFITNEASNGIDYTNFTTHLLYSLGILSGELDISISKCSSKPMVSFIQKILQLGINIGKTNPDIDIKQLLPSFSQTQINEVMKNAAKQREEEIKHVFQNRIKFANIIMDTGTINRFKILHFLLTNPNYPSIIWPIDNFENLNFTASDYAYAIQSVIDSLKPNIQPVAIIADQQSAQVKGICELITSHPSPLIKGIIHLPCVAHLTNLIYTEILANQAYFPYLQAVDDLIKFCRTNIVAKQIGKMCPTLVKTRWVYLSDVLEFFEEHLETINTIREACNQPSIPQQIIEFGQILTPLRVFTYDSEKRDAKLTDLLPRIEQTYNALLEVRNTFKCDESKAIMKFVLATFIARMNSLPMNIVKMTFAISLEGRKKMRQIYPHLIRNDILHDPSNDGAQEDEPNEYYTEEELHYFTNNNDTQVIEIEEIHEKYDLVQTITENIRVLETHERFEVFSRARSELMETDDIYSYDWYENLFPIAQQTLAEYAHVLDLKNVTAFVHFMTYWWFEANLEGFEKYQATDTTDIYWSRLNTCSTYKDFSYICMRLSSIGISEAEVERLFGIHKSMLSRQVTNLGTDTLHARCVLHLSKDIDLNDD